LLGYTKNQIIGNKVWELGILKDIVPNHDKFFELQEKGYVRYENLPLETSEGKIIEVEFVSNVYLVDHHKVIQCNIRDNSERKRSEKLLEYAKMISDAQIETSPDGILVVDENAKMISCNKNFGALWSIPQDIIDTRDDKIMIEYVLKYLKNPDEFVEKVNYLYSHKDESSKDEIEFKDGRFFDRYSAPLVSNDGKYYGRVWYFHDTTKLKQAENQFRTIFENARDGIMLANSESKMFYIANQVICNILGYTLEEIQNIGVNDIHPEKDLPYVIEQFEKQLRGEITLAVNIPLLSKNGNIIYADVNSAPIEIEGKKYLLGMFRDITERKKLEEEKELYAQEKLQRAKMNAIGQLAGGIAHDFNNILTAIIGTTELITNEYSDLPCKEDLKEIKESANRAASLTAQLLAFSRKQPINPRLSDMNEIISHSLKMINRIIGENIELVFITGKNFKLIYVDPSQVEQIFINLAVNAKDAMPLGGKLTITTGLVEFNKEMCSHHRNSHPGEYMVLEIEDSGTGISKDDLEHIFEPFFTTKQVGQGTGLGLSIIHGIVEQNKGFIEVESEIGKGTKFSIFFPAIHEKSMDEIKKSTEIINLSGNETILLVEDEKSIIKLVSRILEGQGYNIITAANGEEALKLAEINKFDLLLSDVIMPKMNGRILYEKIKTIYPNMKVLFMSGYTYEVIKTHGVESEGCGFIQKPYQTHELLSKIREILDQ